MVGEGAFEAGGGVNGGGDVIVGSAVRDVGIGVGKGSCGCRHRGNHGVAGAVGGAAIDVVARDGGVVLATQANATV